MKLVDVTQSVSSQYKGKSDRTKAQAKQVRSEPACVSVMRGTEPGVVRVQAARLNPEICIVVVRQG
jgi:hypothetical protein